MDTTFLQEESKMEDKPETSDDWQAVVLRNKNLTLPLEKNKSNQILTTAVENGPASETEQQMSSTLGLTFGKIEYSPCPRNCFYFRRGISNVNSQQMCIMLNANEMLSLIKLLPDAMDIAHEIETKNEEKFERKLRKEFPDLEMDDGSGKFEESQTEDESSQEMEPNQNRIYSKMIQRKGINFVSLDVSKYNGTSYISLKTYYLSKSKGDKVELLGSKTQFYFSAYDDLDGIVKFYKNCMMLNKSVQQRLKENATTNRIKYARPLEKDGLDQGSGKRGKVHDDASDDICGTKRVE